MVNPNGESGGAGDSGMCGSLETRTVDAQPMGLLAHLLCASGAERFIM